MQDKGKAAVQQSKVKLERRATLTGKPLEQVKQVVSGNRIIAGCIVSFFDPEARPIKKVTEFGYKVRIDEKESGFVTGYAVL